MARGDKTIGIDEVCLAEYSRKPRFPIENLHLDRELLRQEPVVRIYYSYIVATRAINAVIECFTRAAIF